VKHPVWQDIALRLALAAIAGAIIGFNRTEHGRPAGIRTTMLVCIAASIAMIEANLIAGTTGKTPNSFVNMDILRFPLGVLSGIGFIGAGVILRQRDIVVGVTTAATMWFGPPVALSFGYARSSFARPRGSWRPASRRRAWIGAQARQGERILNGNRDKDRASLQPPDVPLRLGNRRLHPGDCRRIGSAASA